MIARSCVQFDPANQYLFRCLIKFFLFKCLLFFAHAFIYMNLFMWYVLSFAICRHIFQCFVYSKIALQNFTFSDLIVVGIGMETTVWETLYMQFNNWKHTINCFIIETTKGIGRIARENWEQQADGRKKISTHKTSGTL